MKIHTIMETIKTGLTGQLSGIVDNIYVYNGVRGDWDKTLLSNLPILLITATAISCSEFSHLGNMGYTNVI